MQCQRTNIRASNGLLSVRPDDGQPFRPHPEHLICAARLMRGEVGSAVQADLSRAVSAADHALRRPPDVSGGVPGRADGRPGTPPAATFW